MQNIYLDLNWSSLTTLLQILKKECPCLSIRPFPAFAGVHSLTEWNMMDFPYVSGAKDVVNSPAGEETTCLQKSWMLKDQSEMWLKTGRRWEPGSISPVGMILVIVTLATRQTALAMHHCQPSLMFARACVCVHARACQTLFSAGWGCQCSAGDAAAASSSLPDPPMRRRPS